MCFQKLFWKKVKDFPKCVYYLTDMMNLKSKTREDRTSGIQIQCKIEDDTNIENITSEKFLSLVNTKRDFIKRLSCKIAQVFSAAEKRYIVAYSITAESSIVHFPDELKFHPHEEADTLIVLQSIDVAKSNPFCQLYVACSDTDVLLLLLYFYPQIWNNTIFHAITWEMLDVGCWMCIKSIREWKK